MRAVDRNLIFFLSWFKMLIAKIAMIGELLVDSVTVDSGIIWVLWVLLYGPHVGCPRGAPGKFGRWVHVGLKWSAQVGRAWDMDGIHTKLR